MSKASNVKKKREGLPSLPSLPSDWVAVELASGSKIWSQITPLVRQAIATGISPSAVDETLVQATAAAALARSVGKPGIIASYARLGWNRLAEASPELGLTAIPKPGRATPRRDQWKALDPAFRTEFDDFLNSFGHDPATIITNRNLLLRAKRAVDNAGVKLKNFSDLFGEEARGAVLSDVEFFGLLEEANQARSKYLEFGCRNARSVGDKIVKSDIDNLLTGDIRLPQRRSGLSKKSVQRIDALKGTGQLDALVGETERCVRHHAASGGEEARAQAQTALMVRIALGAACPRKELMSATFDGPVGWGHRGRRPALTLRRNGDVIEIEDSLSFRTAEMIDIYYATATSEAGSPRYLYEHAPGVLRDETSLSENIRRLGRNVGLALSPSTLKNFAAALLIAYAKAHPDKLDLLDIQEALRISQFINFKSRYGVLCSDDLFEKVAAVSGLR